MFLIARNPIWITAFVLCTLAEGFAFAQQEKQYLDAGKGQPPFDVTRHSLPTAEIVPAGPPKDGVPALDQPEFVPATQADKFLSKHDKFLGIEYKGIDALPRRTDASMAGSGKSIESSPNSMQF